MASIRERGPASSPLLFAAAVAASFGSASACSFDWEGYDPRLASNGAPGATGPGAGGDGGAGGVGIGGMNVGGMGAGGMGGDGGGAGGAPSTGFRLQYKNANPKADDIQMQPHFKIVNETLENVPLSDLEIRYWFTRDGMGNFIYDCDFAQFNCIHTSGAFVPASGAKADMYAAISFAVEAGVLIAGTDSGEIQARLHTQNFTTMNQAGDYSFDPTKTSFTDWANVTLYSKGVLVWGNEP
ncbi:cellulose binding domain-containing protein [Polyangium sp. y55x31]|uniref:cellulose binding domain-containing protein n=1 Tax=Polyangium sp. y55x31 TaxID=3042688 RepID=UPI002482C1C7|nr:cellulose binding domain-containing protein [Polyangium sp. y55x31]MDI1481349.1 cellulose binding domain-containing protein [Polyangium sp. y55x31]